MGKSSVSVMKPWSRAHVSFDGGPTTSSASRFPISRAISSKVATTSPSIGAQSVPAWGHVSCTPL